MELKNFRQLFTTMSEKKTIATVAKLVHGWAAPRPRTSLGPDVAPAPTWGICNNNNDDLYAESGETLQALGSFSAESKPNFASKYSLELGSIWKEDWEKGDDWKKKIWLKERS